MPIHHATIAKAAKSGVVLRQIEESERIEAHWTERNKRGYVANAGQAPLLVDSMATLKMLALEYPELKCAQPDLKRDDYRWTVSLRGDVIGGPDASLKAAWDEAYDVMTSSDDDAGDEQEPEDVKRQKKAVADVLGADEEGDETEDGDAGKSKIKKRYKTAYKPFKNTNGDDLAAQLAAHLKVKDADDPKGRMKVDLARLKRFAVANGVWDERYEQLNAGMRRLNVGNRLRAKVRKGYEISWVK